MNKIVINGNVFETNGKTISICNGTVIVDGNIIKNGLVENINVTIQGDVEKIDCSGSVNVEGNVIGNIDCGGSVDINRDVKGSIKCGGSCTCGTVSGDIVAGGSINCRR